MSVKKPGIKLAFIVFFLSSMSFATPIFEKKAPPSFADHIQMSKDPVDGGWLPNLTGLPNQEEIELLTKHIPEVMKEEKDSKCTSIDYNLRMTVFQHFVIHQQMVNAQNIYFNEQAAHRWAHVLAMILKESSGDSTNITDMSGHSISTFKPQTNLQRWKSILNLTLQKHIKMNYQTNFGLTQTSADRLFNAFHLAQNQSDDTEYLEGKEGILSKRKIPLNTAIAIRRLIWFYQDFAQGRIIESDVRVHKEESTSPKFSRIYRAGLRMALLYCGTRFMFNQENSDESLEEAIASISYCKLGNAQLGYGRNEIDEECFAQWVTLCPALNIDIAHLTPLKYFETRKVKPVCEDTFNRLIIKRPPNK